MARHKVLGKQTCVVVTVIVSVTGIRRGIEVELLVMGLRCRHGGKVRNGDRRMQRR